MPCALCSVIANFCIALPSSLDVGGGGGGNGVPRKEAESFRFFKNVNLKAIPSSDINFNLELSMLVKIRRQ